jgi:hypothetical protein
MAKKLPCAPLAAPIVALRRMDAAGIFYIMIYTFFVTLYSVSESATFYGDMTLFQPETASFVPGMHCFFCGPVLRTSVTLTGLSSAQELVDAVQHTQTSRLRQGPPPSILKQAPVGFSAPLPGPSNV